jgi:hypothetical protein
MHTYDITGHLQKKLVRIGKKDKILAQIFYRKVQEIVSRDDLSCYKNLRSPLNTYKGIHLTSNYILLFAVTSKHVVFVDIRHWDDVFGRNR